MFDVWERSFSEHSPFPCVRKREILPNPFFCVWLLILLVLLFLYFHPLCRNLQHPETAVIKVSNALLVFNSKPLELGCCVVDCAFQLNYFTQCVLKDRFLTQYSHAHTFIERGSYNHSSCPYWLWGDRSKVKLQIKRWLQKPKVLIVCQNAFESSAKDNMRLQQSELVSSKSFFAQNILFVFPTLLRKRCQGKHNDGISYFLTLEDTHLIWLAHIRFS